MAKQNKPKHILWLCPCCGRTLTSNLKDINPVYAYKLHIDPKFAEKALKNYQKFVNKNGKKTN